MKNNKNKSHYQPRHQETIPEVNDTVTHIYDHTAVGKIVDLKRPIVWVKWETQQKPTPCVLEELHLHKTPVLQEDDLPDFEDVKDK